MVSAAPIKLIQSQIVIHSDDQKFSILDKQEKLLNHSIEKVLNRGRWVRTKKLGDLQKIIFLKKYKFYFLINFFNSVIKLLNIFWPIPSQYFNATCRCIFTPTPFLEFYNFLIAYQRMIMKSQFNLFTQH